MLKEKEEESLNLQFNFDKEKFYSRWISLNIYPVIGSIRILLCIFSSSRLLKNSEIFTSLLLYFLPLSTLFQATP